MSTTNFSALAFSASSAAAIRAASSTLAFSASSAASSASFPASDAPTASLTTATPTLGASSPAGTSDVAAGITLLTPPVAVPSLSFPVGIPVAFSTPCSLATLSSAVVSSASFAPSAFFICLAVSMSNRAFAPFTCPLVSAGLFITACKRLNSCAYSSGVLGFLIFSMGTAEAASGASRVTSGASGTTSGASGGSSAALFSSIACCTKARSCAVFMPPFAMPNPPPRSNAPAADSKYSA